MCADVPRDGGVGADFLPHALCRYPVLVLNRVSIRGGARLPLVLAVALAASSCALDRSGLMTGSGMDGGPDVRRDGDMGCPFGFVDLDGQPANGCECEVQPESCDGADDDCDGRVDEDSAEACGTPGTCSEGSRACVGGALAECVPDVTPPDEVCEGTEDEDCDGAVDEDCPCTPMGSTRPCGDDRGECVAGMQTCEGAGWGACEGAVGPSAETCNGLDDDCDGAIDGIVEACGVDIGACTTGTRTCTMGSFGACSGTSPTAEVCDGVDNDCDGVVDGFTRACGTSMGLCTVGTETCTGGVFGACSGAGASTEVCDAARADEDCDGASNEGCACDDGDTRACGTCAGATETCDLSGTWGACSRTPATETCDATDEDCDGTTDEGTTCGMCTQVNNGSRSYLFCFDIQRSWSGARAYCQMFGYDLATVEDATENNWLNSQERSLFRNNELWWYGGTDAAMEGTWVWAPTGMTATYFDWEGGGEPDNGTSENCLSNENRANPEWNSDDCTSDRYFVCEAQGS